MEGQTSLPPASLHPGPSPQLGVWGPLSWCWQVVKSGDPQRRQEVGQVADLQPALDALGLAVTPSTSSASIGPLPAGEGPEQLGDVSTPGPPWWDSDRNLKAVSKPFLPSDLTGGSWDHLSAQEPRTLEPHQLLSGPTPE